MYNVYNYFPSLLGHSRKSWIDDGEQASHLGKEDKERNKEQCVRLKG